MLYNSIPHTLRFPPRSSHKKCSINIVKETFENKFFQETVVTTFAFNQSSSYITQNIIVQIITYISINLFTISIFSKVFRIIAKELEGLICNLYFFHLHLNLIRLLFRLNLEYLYGRYLCVLLSSLPISTNATYQRSHLEVY